MLYRIVRWIDEFVFLRYGYQLTSIKYEEPISTCLIMKNPTFTDEQLAYAKDLAKRIDNRN